MLDQVSELTRGREADWTRFVDAHPCGTIFHELIWRDVLQRTFGHRMVYLLAERAGEVVGVLPLVRIKSIFFGTSLVSVPFGVYGGLLTQDAVATQSLVAAAQAAQTAHGAGYVELRHLVPPDGVSLPTKDLYATFVCELPPSREDVLGRMPRKARAEARKAREKAGLTVDQGPLNLNEFHELFARNKRSLGSPVFPKSLFRNIQDILGDRCYTLTVRHEGRPLTSVMNFVRKGTLMAYYSGAAEDANRFSANNLMYVAVMEDGVDRGLTEFDFGRSRKATGAFEFKKNQGFEAKDLFYQYLLKPGDQLPEVNA
ncbi:MAG TPA: FemAB family PEP-CTERM system-associated protein, partial [Planctomycetota bacterium]|nr:FemAB family PEP-CTERM system-associated protein [Planctomycetota bacterium]